MLKVTVITVVYNCVTSIEETIKSVLEQSYPNIEYIVIDGGSSDGTFDIIKKYESSIQCLISEKDFGIYDAMNKGLNNATGDFINFLNAGDKYFNSSVIESFVDNIQEINKTYYGDYYDCSLNKIIYQKNRHEILMRNINHQSIFYSKLSVKDLRFNLEYKILADWEFNIRLFSKEKFIYLPIIIVNYEGNGISDKKPDMVFWKNFRNIILSNYNFSTYIKVCFKRCIRKIKQLWRCGK